jgi:IS30 family transposase
MDTFPDDAEMRVSHETIYLSLFVQSRGALRKELTRYLRSGHSTGRPKGHTVMNGQGQLRGTLNISERPAEANDRAVPGHWEGDLLMGKGMRAIATLVERKTRFVMLIALAFAIANGCLTRGGSDVGRRFGRCVMSVLIGP